MYTPCFYSACKKVLSSCFTSYMQHACSTCYMLLNMYVKILMYMHATCNMQHATCEDFVVHHLSIDLHLHIVRALRSKQPARSSKVLPWLDAAGSVINACDSVLSRHTHQLEPWSQHYASDLYTIAAAGRPCCDSSLHRLLSGCHPHVSL